MDDLLGRLIRHSQVCGDTPPIHAVLMAQAADEITVLRARLDTVTEERNVQRDLCRAAEDAADGYKARLDAVEKQREHAWSMVQKADNQVVQAAANSINSLARAERAEAALATARRDALEEAAGLTPYDCDGDSAGQFDNHVFVKRDAIRALIAQEDAQREEGE